MKHNLAERRAMVYKNDALSISEQCELVSVHRSGFYYKPQGESPLNLDLMRLIDAYFLEHPHSGVVTLCAYLCLTRGYTLNVKRVRRLMRLMGLMAVYPGKKLSMPNKEHTIHPYLLRGLKIERNNQVWQTDITYIPMKKGFMYMMAVIDVKSRFILNWGVSNTMDAAWCTEVLKETIELHGAPEIFNPAWNAQIRAVSLLPMSFKKCSPTMASKYRWMAEVGHWTTFILNGSGVALSMNMFILSLQRMG